MSDLRERILGATQRFRPVAVECPLFGETVWIRPLSVSAMTRIHGLQSKAPERVPLVVLVDCVCDESGKRLFTEADEAALAELPGKPVEALIQAITEAGMLGQKAPDLLGE